MDEILDLSEAERLVMLEKIWDSIDKKNVQISQSQMVELDKRLARFQRGETKFYSWEEVKRDMQNLLNEPSGNLG